MIRMRFIVTLILVVLCLTLTGKSIVFADGVEESIQRGLNWLKAQQEEDGSWESYPAITALATLAFLRSPSGEYNANTPFLKAALEYIKSHAKEDGSISLGDLPNYNTANCLIALVKADKSGFEDIIQKGQSYLVEAQFDEGEGYTIDDPSYGGIGYGGSGRPDLSNLQWALEALKATDLPENSDTWDKALIFLERCQNREESNDQPWAENDGGFVYQPGASKAGGTTSYGGMTYAGMRSFIYANVAQDDPRVQAAVGWIKKNYTVEENPELGMQGLYYYYHTMAKAFKAYGEPVIIDAEDVSHNWYEDLSSKLVSIQHPEGYWVNSISSRWWEDNKVLVTCYSLLALEYGYD